MQHETRQQVVISGVGGQGVLFITRLLAEAAIRKGLPVFTSETHGMAQRGGTVVSHLKIGDFSSPLIRPGHADGLLVLKNENLAQHGAFLKPGGWAVVNGRTALPGGAAFNAYSLDADQMAAEIDNPKAVNLIILGAAFSAAAQAQRGPESFFCNAEDIHEILHARLGSRVQMLKASLAAFQAGCSGQS